MQNATWVREKIERDAFFASCARARGVRECFFSSFIYSFDLISCTVYKLNLMSFSIAAVVVAAAAAWRSLLFHLCGVREQCYAHEIEQCIWRRVRVLRRIGIRLQIIVVVLCFSSLAVVYLNANFDPYARHKEFPRLRVLHLCKRCGVDCVCVCVWTVCYSFVSVSKLKFINWICCV